MADFEKFYAKVKQSEKGYQNHRNDEGNKNSQGTFVGTNYGISAKMYEYALAKVPSENDMRTLSPAVAKEIFKNVFWDGTIHGDQLSSQQVANIIGDMAVNSGEKNAFRLVTQRLWLSGYQVDPQKHHVELKPDVITALNQLTPRQEALFLNAYREDRLDYYAGLGHHYDAFKHGWENRVNANFPEQPVAGWDNIKTENQHFNPRALELVLFHDDLKKMDGVIGPKVQDALKEFQTAHALEPSGYIDSATKLMLDWEISQNATAKALGDINHSQAQIRDARFELQADISSGGLHHGLATAPTVATYTLQPLDHGEFSSQREPFAIELNWSELQSAPSVPLYDEPVGLAMGAAKDLQSDHHLDNVQSIHDDVSDRPLTAAPEIPSYHLDTVDRSVPDAIAGNERGLVQDQAGIADDHSSVQGPVLTDAAVTDHSGVSDSAGTTSL